MRRMVVLAALLMALPVAAPAAKAEFPAVEYDLGGWEDIWRELPAESRALFGGRGVRELMELYRSGKGAGAGAEAIKAAALRAVSDSVKSMLSVAGAALCLAAAEIAVGDSGGGLGEMLLFCMSGACISGITAAVCAQFRNAAAAVKELSRVTEAVSPVLIALISACGGISVSAAQPAAIVLCGAVTGFFRRVLMPLALVMCAFSTAGCITGQAQLKSLAKLTRSFLKWSMGLTFTVFLGSVSIRGLNAAALDGAGARALKYAFDKSIPVVGGVISGTYESIRAGGIVLKNAAGTAAASLMAMAVTAPAVRMLAVIAALRILSVLCAPAAEGKISGMIDGAADSCTYMFAVTAVAALMNMMIVAAALLSSGTG